MKRFLPSAIALLLFLGVGCAAEESPSGVEEPLPDEDSDPSSEVAPGVEEPEGGLGLAPSPWVPPFASEVITFDPGPGAGFGAAGFPDVVLGPPGTATEIVPSLDVLTLGTGGEIVLGFGARVIVDGPGPDFSVHENPFWPGGSEENVFAEFGEVAVSADGDEWWTYPCEPVSGDVGTYPGCAGWTPTQTFSVTEGRLLTLDETGGDGFDLAESGFDAIRYVRIRDLSDGGPAPSAGFDLDAITLLHWDHDETLFPAD